MLFRVAAAGDANVYVLSREKPLKVGDVFELPGIEGRECRVRSIEFDPLGEDEPEMRIVAE